MGRQIGIMKIKGTIGDFSFYETPDGALIRKKGGVDPARIANDPAFERTRENNQEFGTSASAGKLLRLALLPFILKNADNRAFPRLMQLMSRVKNMDPVSARGARNVAEGILLPRAKELLKGFEFNIKGLMSAVLNKEYILDRVTGVISINDLIPTLNITPPEGVTHFVLKGAWVRIDFATGVKEVFQTNAFSRILDSTPSNVVLTPTGVPAGPGTDFYLLKIEFFQQVNGVQYTLKDKSVNAVAIIEVA